MAKPLGRWIAGSAAAGALIAISAGVYARFVEPKRLEITHLDFRKGEHTLTIAFVTDIHVGPHFSAGDMHPTVDALRRLQPDVLLFGGDFICESPRFLREIEPQLTAMTATARIGSWGIWGNHDLANIRERVQPVLERSGVAMLTNESVRIADDLWVVGIDDVLLGKSDVAKSFADVPGNARAIVLWHEPDRMERVVEYRPMLALSGHTHGGQVRLPGIGPLATPDLGKRYVAGRYDVRGMPLYVSRGIGMYRPPVRFNCRPELLVIRV